jgi:hypothetical protein
MEYRDIPSNRELLPALLAKRDSSRGLTGNKKHCILAFLSSKHLFACIAKKISLTPLFRFSINKKSQREVSGIITA